MTVIEVERKRELAGAKDVVATRLDDLGYHLRGTFIEVDTYYSSPQVNYLDTVECLRVRQRDSFAEITYKPPSHTGTRSHDDIIAKRETNVTLSGIEQAETANDLLLAIGMIRLVRVEKNRTVYRHPRNTCIAISLDTIGGVGTFIETEVTATHRDDATMLLEETEQQLGLTALPVISLPYRDLVLRHNRFVPQRR